MPVRPRYMESSRRPPRRRRRGRTLRPRAPRRRRSVLPFVVLAVVVAGGVAAAVLILTHQSRVRAERSVVDRFARAWARRAAAGRPRRMPERAGLPAGHRGHPGPAQWGAAGRADGRRVPLRHAGGDLGRGADAGRPAARSRRRAAAGGAPGAGQHPGRPLAAGARLDRPAPAVGGELGAGREVRRGGRRRAGHRRDPGALGHRPRRPPAAWLHVQDHDADRLAGGGDRQPAQHVPGPDRRQRGGPLRGQRQPRELRRGPHGVVREVVQLGVRADGGAAWRPPAGERGRALRLQFPAGAGGGHRQGEHAAQGGGGRAGGPRRLRRRHRRADRPRRADGRARALAAVTASRCFGRVIPKRYPGRASEEGGMAARPDTAPVTPHGKAPPVADPGGALLAIDHEELVIRRGRRTGLYAIVAVHSTTLGPALGGCRMWRYPSSTEAARDALRLSRAMTLKAAAAGLHLGGGKGVICLPPGRRAPEGAPRRSLLLDFADAVDALDGSYITAEDVGTNARDMVTIAEHTRFVTGLPTVHGGSGDPSPHTAAGVVAAMRACCAARLDGPDLEGRTVAVVGCGRVGEQLARRLSALGVRLLLADIDERKRALAAEPPNSS